MQKLIFQSFIVVLLYACNYKSDDAKRFKYTDALKQSVESNPENEYFISHPEELKSNLPILIGLDANGDGKKTVERIRHSLNYQEVIIIASNTIQNGSSNYDVLINELLVECSKKYQGDSKNTYLVGFSGGARMAHIFANSFPIKGVIMFGAGPGPNMPKTRTFVSCGLRDFNFLETYFRPTIDLFDHENYFVDYSLKGHEWPDSSTITDALLYFFPSEVLIENRKEALINRSDSMAVNGNGLFAFKNLEKAYKFENDKDEKRKIRASAKDLLENNLVKRDLIALENHLRTELYFRDTYVNQTAIADFDYWKSEIDGLREKAMFSSNSKEIEHAERLLSYMGIMFYSRLKVMIFSGGKQQTVTLIKAFEYLEPENPDMFYFKALMYSKNGQMDSAGHYIAIARKFGLKE